MTTSLPSTVGTPKFHRFVSFRLIRGSFWTPELKHDPRSNRTRNEIPMLTIDGSFGEGGGQIIRTSLALSLVTGKPFHSGSNT